MNDIIRSQNKSNYSSKGDAEQISGLQMPLPDLFGNSLQPKYPAVPGHRRTGLSGGTDSTSALAARSIAPNAHILRMRCLTEITAAGPAGCTADECASRLKCSQFAIRPRVSELTAQGFVVPSGKRRKNESGKGANVLLASQKGIALIEGVAK